MRERLTLGRLPRAIRALFVAAGIAVAFGLGLCGLVAIRSITMFRAELSRAESAATIFDEATALGIAVRNAELAERDTLLFRRQADPATFRKAATEARASLHELAAAAKDHAWLAPRVGLLTLLLETRLAALRAGVARAVAAKGPGAVLTADAIATDRTSRVELDAAITETARTAAERQQAHLVLFRQSGWEAATALVAAAAAALVLLVAAAFGVGAGRRRLLAAEQTLRAEGERLAAMVNHIRDGVAVFDRADRLMLWNSAFFPATGLPFELGERGTPFSRFAAAAADWFPPLLDEPRPHREPIVAEMQRQGRVLEVWRSELPDGGQILAVADISKRVETEQMARQAQRMDALGQLTGGIAHDMNNLLQVISANLEQLTVRLPTDGGLRMRLEAAMTGVARGANLTRHLLAFARRQPLATEVIEPGELIRGTADLLRRTLGETYEVRLALDERESLWAIRTDPQQLENAVLNLALNARDAMPDGGRLVIIVTNRVLDDEYAAHHAEVTPGQYVMIAVADTGQGMSPEQIARAAEPFYTTKGGGRGTGLGLSMVYGLVRQSGGHFRIDSAPGEGTTVRLFIPRTHAAVTVAPKRALPPAAAGELVLVAEDDQAVRAVAVSTLNDLGYRTLEAENADAALELLRAGARPDVLFTDMVMPGSLGVAELVRAARKILPGLAVLFTTGYTDNPQLSAEALGPAARLLAKPWTRAVLAESIREAIRLAGVEVRGRLFPSQGLRILVVEDEPMVRDTITDLLNLMGHGVQGVAAAAEARVAADTADLVITDAGLPDADGAVLAAELRCRRPDLPLIVVSGEARAAGDSSIVWLEKPFGEARLRRAIAEARAVAAGQAENTPRAADGGRQFRSA